MPKFKVGDHVVYTGRESTSHVGRHGTVVEPKEGYRHGPFIIPVEWDNHGYFGVYPYNIELEPVGEPVAPQTDSYAIHFVKLDEATWRIPELDIYYRVSTKTEYPTTFTRADVLWPENLRGTFAQCHNPESIHKTILKYCMKGM